METLIGDLLYWANDLKPWQQDALRRLFARGELKAADLNELVAMVKEAHGDGPPSSIPPDPLAANHIPGAGSGNSVQLVSLSELTNVNAFPDGRALSFEPSGLTVLFGENGAGKSGYARVLKNACRARRREPVQSNAFTGGAGHAQIPSAKIQVLVDGNAKEVSWVQGGNPDADLGNVSVYDSACARDYIEMEGEPGFQPYGLGHLNRLVAAQREMHRILTDEQNAIELNPAIFQPLKGGTAVGALVENPGAGTNIVELRRLATMSEADLQRIDFLEGALRELNPEPKARALDALADRLGLAAERASSALRYVTDAATAKLKGLHQSKRDADAAYELAQRQLHGGDQDGVQDKLLLGTGNAVWQTLYKAAEAFSVEYAYVGHAFPHTSSGAKCVLCQAELGPDARSRMERFATFVAGQAGAHAIGTNQTLVEALGKIRDADLEPLDKPTLEELAGSLPSLHALVLDTVAAWNARRTWLLDSSERDDWSRPEPIIPTGDPLDLQLRNAKAKLKEEASTLRKSVDPKERGKLQDELRELKARESLRGLLPAIEQFVLGSVKREALSRCLAALNTQGISTKMTALAKKHVTTALAVAMNEELSALGYKRKVRPTLDGKTSDGKTKMTLQIEGTKTDAHRVLSEGEQRAMALALFLAEVSFQGHHSTVIFDDPSTSLDHRHRRRMAQRLVALACERQVLIFTHDAVFLSEIDMALKKSGASATYKSIGWGDAAPGHVEEGLTWETKNCSMRLMEIEGVAKAIKTTAGDYPSEGDAQRIAEAYSKVRGTIERAIREEFLSNTIQPFSDAVSVESFGIVVGHPQDEVDSLMDIYDRACEATFAHDTPAERQLPLPDAEQLISDINLTLELVRKAAARRRAYQTQRGERTKARKKAFAGA
ncbi:AAA family ATPase [Mesoterricola sediminis]|uniref:Protein CR006 P-loop domain-containing protein n=1 Tax=Mesoterricola sediminis TaxID=2927980 RepID=A0AA48KFW0_9BACT|nr:AAA family ATPase [Mesoterricola sediminis]BDU76838.1 hypothetical protein METESE_17960 [Mesoterricola sediminis]